MTNTEIVDCANCGNQIPQGDAFCIRCGASSTPPEPPMNLCQQCGSELPDAAAFCGKCGARCAPPPLGGQETPSALVPSLPSQANDSHTENVESADELLNLACEYASKGDYDGTIACHNRLVALAPEDPKAYTIFALACVANGNCNLGIAYHSIAIKRDPQNTEAYKHRAKTYLAKGDYDGAVADFTIAIRLDPQNAEYYHYRGCAYAHKEYYDEAVANLELAAKLDPENTTIRENLEFAMARKGGAIKQFFRRLFQADGFFGYSALDLPEPPNEENLESITAFIKSGNSHADNGEYDKAVADYTRAIEIDPKFPIAYCQRGEAYEKTGDYVGALRDYRKAFVVEPELTFFYKPKCEYIGTWKADIWGRRPNSQKKK